MRANSIRSKRLNFLCSVALLASMTACGTTEGGTTVSVPGFEDSALDVYEIEVLPDFSALQTLTERPGDRFVMVNMLVFKDMATGEGFEGLMGREAYGMYAEGLRDAQMAIDSRLNPATIPKLGAQGWKASGWFLRRPWPKATQVPGRRAELR